MAPAGGGPSASSRTAFSEAAPFYSSPHIDRAGHLRTDTSWLSSAITNPDTVIVPVLDGKSLISHDAALLPTVASLPETLRQHLSQYPWGREGASTPGPSRVAPSPIKVVCFLGLRRGSGEPVFAVAMRDAPQEGAQDEASSPLGSLLALHPEAEWADLRKEGPNLAAEEAGLLAYARGLLEWHAKNRFCGKCGGVLAPGEGGHTLQCSAAAPVPAASAEESHGAQPPSPCSSIFYPRLDPAVIMRVTSGDHVLLGRQARWPRGRYSVLAGFVEVGEVFEEAVAREVLEESGVPVLPGSIRYVASQPWPFPSSLMIGFSAEAERIARPGEVEASLSLPPGGLRCGMTLEERAQVLEPLLAIPPPRKTQELEDTQWVHRELVRSLLSWQYSGRATGQPNTSGNAAGLFVPGPYSLSHMLLCDWMFGTTSPTAENVDQGWAGDRIPSAQIDKGRFKYVLMRLTESATGRSKLVVRGHAGAEYHMHILERTRARVKAAGFEVQPLGGGRIEHDSENRSIKIYGYSQAYGLADHEVSKALTQRFYPLHTISTSDEGY